jgi:6-phosphogluconolactonase/glucosamine-6-phosphate isomerase/deaminase
MRICSAAIDWTRTHVFMCDERHVQFNSDDSNYGAYVKAFGAEPMPTPILTIDPMLDRELANKGNTQLVCSRIKRR